MVRPPILKRNILFPPIGLRDPEAPEAIVEAAIRKFRLFDVLENDAEAIKRGVFTDLLDEEWADGSGLKFSDAIRMCRTAWTQLMKQIGQAINVSGVAG